MCPFPPAGLAHAQNWRGERPSKSSRQPQGQPQKAHMESRSGSIPGRYCSNRCDHTDGGRAGGRQMSKASRSWSRSHMPEGTFCFLQPLVF